MNDLDPRVAHMARELVARCAADDIVLRVTETRPAAAAAGRDIQDFGYAFRAYPARINGAVDPDTTSPIARQRWTTIARHANAVGLQADVSLFWFEGAPSLETLRKAL